MNEFGSSRVAVSLQVRGKSCVVLGYSSLALDWAQQLHAAGARVKVIDAHAKPPSVIIEDLDFITRAPMAEDFRDVFLVVLAYPRKEDCEQAFAHLPPTTWVAALHFPELSPLTLEHSWGEGALNISFSLGLKDPRDSARIVETWSRHFGRETLEFLKLMTAIYQSLEEKFEAKERRELVLESFYTSKIFSHIKSHRYAEAERLAKDIVASFAAHPGRQQRKHERVGIDVKVAFSVHGTRYPGRLFNCSVDGLFVQSEKTFPRMTRIEQIEFTLPGSPTLSDIGGVVVWTNPPSQPTTPMYPPGFGLMFEPLRPEQTSIIEAFVRRQIEKERME